MFFTLFKLDKWYQITQSTTDNKHWVNNTQTFHATCHCFLYVPKNIRKSVIFWYFEGLYEMRCAIWHHLYNLKNVENTHGGVLLLVKCRFESTQKSTKSNTTPFAFIGSGIWSSVSGSWVWFRILGVNHRDTKCRCYSHGRRQRKNQWVAELNVFSKCLDVQKYSPLKNFSMNFNCSKIIEILGITEMFRWI